MLKKVLLLLFVFHVISSLQAQRMIPVWCYYQVPPFSMEGESSLASEFVELMNIYTSGEYYFDLVTLPRVRLDYLLANEAEGILLFSAPAWMNDSNQSRYTWSDPILRGENRLVTRTGSGLTPMSFSLKAQGKLRFGGIAGRNYNWFFNSIQNSEFQKSYVKTEVENLKKLNYGRIDFTLQPGLIAEHATRSLGFEDNIVLHDPPLIVFLRYLMVQSDDPKLKEWVMALVDSLPSSPGWAYLVDKYNLQTMSD